MHDPSLGQPPAEQPEPRQTQSHDHRGGSHTGSRLDLETNPYAHTSIAPGTPPNQWDVTELCRLRNMHYHPLQEQAERELNARQQRQLPHWDEKRDALPEEMDYPLDPGSSPIEQPEFWADERALVDAETRQATASEGTNPDGSSSESADIDASSTDLDWKRFVAMTVYPLVHFDRLAYISKCTHCESRPYSEGPHHDRSCPRYERQLRYDTHHATRKYCKHEDCGARPFVAGFHHHSDCPRGFDAQTDWTVADDGYSTPCVCGAKPYSEGPHHSSDCEYHTSTPQFRTDRTHSARCATCDARPFPPGPHHEHTCEHHVNAIPIPLALANND